jgi:hypothetical protein
LAGEIAGAVHVGAVGPVSAGVMLERFAVALPPLVRVRVKVIAWPTDATFRLAARVAAREAGNAAERGEVATVAGVSAWPVFASIPLTVAPRVKLPSRAGVHVQVSWTVPPPPATGWGGAGVAVPQVGDAVPDAVVVTWVTLAPPPPESVTVSVTVSGWPAVIPLEGVTAIPAASAAGVTRVSGIPVTAGLAFAPEFASAAVTTAPSVFAPAEVAVQLQVKVVVQPEAIVAGSAGATAVQVEPVGVRVGPTPVTFAAAPPPLLIQSASVIGSPASAGAGGTCWEPA